MRVPRVPASLGTVSGLPETGGHPLLRVLKPLKQKSP
jgi:hypothetical protein